MKKAEQRVGKSQDSSRTHRGAPSSLPTPGKVRQLNTLLNCSSHFNRAVVAKSKLTSLAQDLTNLHAGFSDTENYSWEFRELKEDRTSAPLHSRATLPAQTACESESRSVMSNSLQPHGLYSPWNSPGQNTGWVAFPSSGASSQPRDQTQISFTAGRFFTS